MDYDPTLSGLLSPERRPPLGPELPWNPNAMFAELARLAYLRFEHDTAAVRTLSEALARFGYSGFTGFGAAGEFPQFDARAFAARSAEHGAVVVFRGTRSDSFEDLAADARFRPVKWRGAGLVHRGFWLSLSELIEAVEAWIDSDPLGRLVVTGHSLGAAHATLLAALRPQAELVTFGSPRVGNAAFGSMFAGREVRRYVDCIDLVTRVPPPPYRHIGSPRVIDHTGKLHPAGMSAAEMVSDRLKAALAYAPLVLRPGNCLTRELADHAPINYVSALLGIRTGP